MNARCLPAIWPTEAGGTVEQCLAEDECAGISGAHGEEVGCDLSETVQAPPLMIVT